VHGLADQHLAQHRPNGGLAVAVTAERRAAGPLEGDIATATLPVDHFADEQGAAIAELGRDSAELVAGTGLSQRFGAFGQRVPAERRRPRGGVQRRDVETEFRRQACRRVAWRFPLYHPEP